MASENTKLSMPETGLGLVPDVGGGYFMPRLKGEMGMYLALSGVRAKAADCVQLGICGFYVEREQHEALIKALAAESMLDEATVNKVLASFSTQPEQGTIAANQGLIDSIFSADSVEQIIAGLRSEASNWSMALADSLEKMSPTSLLVTYAQMRRGAELSLHDDLKMEYRIVNRLLANHDFYEGVRALLVDKDFTPKWQPSKLGDIADDEVEKYFEGLDDLELEF